MSIIVSNIQVGLGEAQELCFERARKKLGVPSSAVLKEYIVKRSVDARKKQDIRLVYSVGFQLEDERRIPLGTGVRRQEEAALDLGGPVETPKLRPVVVGFGPAGMFCALLLARHGCRPIVLERGEPVERRVETVQAFHDSGDLCPESNVQFGEGGAGTFSDGKLTTRIGDPRCAHVLRELVAFGAPEEIAQEAKPHIGTDHLRHIVAALRQEVIRLGGEVRFGARMDGLILRGDRVAGVKVDGQELPADRVVLAIGHSARATFAMLLESGLMMEAKPFSVGVRIEHLQSEVDKALYGNFAGHPLLPKGEYQLSHRDREGRGVYTFCMCPGGVVVPSASEEGGIVTNGMSYYRRDGENANAALVVSVDGRDYGPSPLDAIGFQRALERRAYVLTGGYHAPIQTAGRFLEGRPGADLGRVTPTYAIGTCPADLSVLFPPAVTEHLRLGLRIFGRRQPGFDASDAVLTAPETRTSSPVRILRGEDMQADGVAGLYPCGEGAGYAGGIMSAAADGIRVAQQILEELRKG